MVQLILEASSAITPGAEERTNALCSRSRQQRKDSSLLLGCLVWTCSSSDEENRGKYCTQHRSHLERTYIFRRHLGTSSQDERSVVG